MLQLLISNLPIVLCFLCGVGLLVAEAFMPGFGVAGVTGIALELAAVVMTWLWHGAGAALIMTLFILMLLAVAVSLSLRSATKGRLSRSEMILKNTESSEEGYRSSEDMNVFLGREGETTTVLRPAGIADLGGIRLDVVSEGEFIQAGVKVRVIRVDGCRVIVKAV